MSSKKTSKVYEAVFHIVPTVNESTASKVFANVLDFVKKEGRVISSEDVVDMELAYTMFSNGKDGNGKYTRFDNSFFGSIKFESKMAFAVSLREMLYNNENIFRFLILDSVEEDTRIGGDMPADDEEEDNESVDNRKEKKDRKERIEDEKEVVEVEKQVSA